MAKAPRNPLRAGTPIHGSYIGVILCDPDGTPTRRGRKAKAHLVHPEPSDDGLDRTLCGAVFSQWEGQRRPYLPGWRHLPHFVPGKDCRRCVKVLAGWIDSGEIPD